MDRKKIINALDLRPFGAKGWFTNHKLICPWCGKSEKLGFLFENKGVVHHLKCGERHTLYRYLKDTNRLDLWGNERPTVRIQPIVSIKEGMIKKEFILPEKKLPIGFRRVTENAYLDSRGFLEEHYSLFEPGVTGILAKLKNDYIIFKLKHRESIVGWLARSIKSKEWHEENLRQFKTNEASLFLRYENSSETDFSKIVGGFNDITPNTDTIIGVEGLFDKVGVDNKLELYSQENVKCCFFFGNHISEDQALLIRHDFPNVKRFYLLFDYNTEEESKRTGGLLLNYFDTHIARIPWENEDPGSIDRERLFSVLEKAQGVIDFQSGIIKSKIKIY